MTHQAQNLQEATTVFFMLLIESIFGLRKYVLERRTANPVGKVVVEVVDRGDIF
ncbi:hypothetical protein [Lysinibacillus fusiformis]|uniref:hypothetical protein n=1 Tax=Lysinibacillus fusiformis TaxID=28031 RepID=UPI0000F37C39|nr:hypothetical protein [Lysinibacillus fusiformis]EAZ83512.1 hypothetical protein BB14905_00490 [Bacillus sp. B14905]